MKTARSILATLALALSMFSVAEKLATESTERHGAENEKAEKEIRVSQEHEGEHTPTCISGH